jgi:hypothetical protein
MRTLMATTIAAVVAFSLAPPLARAADVPAGGAFTCDFALSSALPPDQLAAPIERDRMFRSARHGFLRKDIPIRLGNELLSGGRYLFKTAQDARDYAAWVPTYDVYDGPFFERPYFGPAECRAWQVIGAADLAGAQTVLRTERFRVPEGNQKPLLELAWPLLRAIAQVRGFSGAWLLYNRADRLVSVISFSADPAIEAAGPLGALMPYPRVFDRTSLVLTRWSPFAAGDHGAPAVWPNSPPLPQPGTSDGVCEVSRGETAATAPSDCVATCGNAVADPGETTLDCPGDVRPIKEP